METRIRPDWASRFSDIIATDGILITLMFPLDTYEGGPPFALSVET